MMISQKLWYFTFYCVVLVIYVAKIEAQSSNHSIYSFGDSTVDPGNNNRIVTPSRGNFQPYGRDYINNVATGRFTNGRQVPDYVASYSNVTNNPLAYLDPLISTVDLRTAVGFGSASTGFDPLTPLIYNTISMDTQLQNFIELKGRLEDDIGIESANDTIARAIIYISCGSNDFILTYFNNPVRRVQYSTTQAYSQFLLQLMRKFIEDLLNQGVTRIAVSGLPPLGCLPFVITVYSSIGTLPLINRRCVEDINAIALNFNTMLRAELTLIQSQNIGSRIVYNDLYGPSVAMIQNPLLYGMVEVNKGCCGTGLVETGLACNPLTPTCPDATKYVFWDATHFTQSAYSVIFNANRQTIDTLLA